VSPPAPLYSGHYDFGFEVAAFAPCGLDESWWVEVGTPGAFEPVSDFITRHIAQFHDGQFIRGSLFVRWRGTVGPRGSYGHRGGYPRVIRVSEVLEVRWPEPNDCAESPVSANPAAQPIAPAAGPPSRGGA
jgi:hypothetical protein